MTVFIAEGFLHVEGYEDNEIITMNKITENKRMSL